MTSRYLTLPTPRFFAHRGASATCPENTLPAFLAAVQAEVPYLELDVWSTADGQVVVHHDASLLRLCGLDRRVADLTLAQVQALDAGYGFSPDGGHSFPFRNRGVKIPTLAEVLTAFPQARLNVEVKDPSPDAAERTVAAVRQTGREKDVLLAAEDQRIMDRLRSACGDIPTGLSFAEAAAFFAWFDNGFQGHYRPPGVALQIPESYGGRQLITPETVAAAHTVGLEVHVWTVNRLADMQRLLGLGVDGIMSDHPELFPKI